MSSSLRTLMAVNKITSFIFVSSVLVLACSADDIYSAVMPQTVTALTGSCVQIPCTFSVSDFEDKQKKAKFIYGVWLKNISQYEHTTSFIAFNSSKNIIKGFSDIKMTGNLSERNCTTVFYNIMMNHSDSYYFRLEMEPNVFRATFNPSTDVSSKTVRINIRNSPQPPGLKPSELKYVMEETTVNLSCSAEAPCPKQPPTISWSNIPQPAHITTQLQENPDKTQSMVSYITFKASYKDHKKNITCTATYPRNTPDYSTVESTVMLRVLFPPKETQFFITPSVGNNVTFTCKSKASPSNDLNYTWYKHGEETPIAWGKEMNLTKTQNEAGSYFCIAQNKHGKQSSDEAQFTDEGQSGSSHLVIGFTGGLLALVLLSTVFFYYMRTKASRQAHVIGSDQAEDKNRDTIVIYENNATVMSMNGEKKDIGDLNYGEIDFSNLQMGHKTKEHSKNDPETEYSELQVTERKRQTNDVQQMDKLYCQVQKK